MKTVKTVWICTVLVLFLLGILTVGKDTFVKVPLGQRAVKTEWGVVVDSTYAPGLVWRIPYTEFMGNDVWLVDIRPKRYEYNITVRTKDVQQLSLKCAILCEMNEATVHKLYDKYQGYDAYEQKIIKDMVTNVTLTLSSFTDIWSFMGSKETPLTEAVKYIIDDQLKNEDLMRAKAFNLLSYKASPEFEKLIEKTVQTKQNIKLEEYKVEQAKLATQRVLEEARQTYEKMAAVAKAEGLTIQIEAAAVQNNPFIAQYEAAKALQKWNGEITLPQTLTIMKGANENGGFPFVPFMRIGK